MSELENAQLIPSSAEPTPSEPLEGDTAASGETDGNSAQPESGDPKPEEKESRAEKRIRELVARAKRAESALAARNMVSPAREPAPPAPTQSAPTAQPKLSDYAVGDGSYYIDAFNEANNQWIFSKIGELAPKIAREEYAKLTNEQKQQQETQAVNQVYETRVKTLKQEYPDFDAVASDTFHVLSELGVQPGIAPIASFIMKHNDGPKLEYYLGKNPEEISRIAALPQDLATFEIANILQEIAPRNQVASSQSSGTEQAASASKAPPPITPIRRMSDTRKKDIYDDDLPFAEFVKLRNAKKTR